jgi:AraC-like DNA-binding protein
MAAGTRTDGIGRFPVKAPLETLLAETRHVALGRFSCAPADPRFTNSGPSSTYCFVFPRTHVWIRHADQPAFLSAPGVATLYNEGQEYERRAADGRGDHCDWCAVHPVVLEEALAEKGVPAATGTRRLFTTAYARTDPAIYLRQRQLFERLGRRKPADPLETEEAALSLLDAVLGQSAAGDGTGWTPPRRHVDLVAHAKALMAQWLDRRFELADLARPLGCSVFHLCRTFRRIEGTTVHAYFTDLRLRSSLERLTDEGEGGITALALDLGFSSHSHFTAAFRRAYRTTPSAFISSVKSGASSRAARLPRP